MSPPKSASQLAAALVVETCIPIVKGEWKNEAPVPGTELLPEQRKRLGLPADGLVMVYEVGDAQVFMHFHGPQATLLYSRGDVDKGLNTLDAALKKAFPSVKQVRDLEHPRGGKKRLRVYEGDLTADRHTTVEIDYPAGGAAAKDKKIVIRVSAFVRPPKKKGLH